jgi:hypothetical protein
MMLFMKKVRKGLCLKGRIKFSGWNSEGIHLTGKAKTSAKGLKAAEIIHRRGKMTVREMMKRIDCLTAEMTAARVLVFILTPPS